MDTISMGERRETPVNQVGFSESRLASLSLEEYLEVIRAEPKMAFAVHVTRQGLRDQSGDWHIAGVGKFHDGFVEILKVGALKSGIGLFLNDSTRANLCRVFGVEDARDETLEESVAYTTIAGGFGYMQFEDKSAIHFALNQVNTIGYGGESNNEIFLVYPYELFAEHIPHRVTGAADGHDHNSDMWAWPELTRGLSVNAGLVFIPEETLVDPATGSQYLLDENNNPIVNGEAVEQIHKLYSHPDLEYLLEELKEVGSVGSERLVREYAQSLPLYRYNSRRAFEQARIDLEGESAASTASIKEKLASAGVTDPHVQAALLESYQELTAMQRAKSEGKPLVYEDDLHEEVNIPRQILMRSGIYYRRVDHRQAITSKEFWTRFFASNPALKPNKVVFYTGDARKAFKDFFSANGVIIDYSHILSEYNAEMRADVSHPATTQKMNEFQTLALSLIHHGKH